MQSPAYEAGLDLDDRIRQIDGRSIRSVAEVTDLLSRHKPGDRIEMTFVDRSGAIKSTTVTLEEDPSLELVTVEATGAAPTAAQRAFRDRWLR
jgi:predicted metalloprotease with PDZ domain